MNTVYFTELSKWRDGFALMTDPAQIAAIKLSAQRELKLPLGPDQIARVEALVTAADDRLWELQYGHLEQRRIRNRRFAARLKANPPEMESL